jgi:hypothetical protein
MIYLGEWGMGEKGGEEAQQNLVEENWTLFKTIEYICSKLLNIFVHRFSQGAKTT